MFIYCLWLPNTKYSVPVKEIWWYKKVEVGGEERPKEHLIVTYKSLVWLVEVIHILNKTKAQIQKPLGNIRSTYLDRIVLNHNRRVVLIVYETFQA